MCIRLYKMWMLLPLVLCLILLPGCRGSAGRSVSPDSGTSVLTDETKAASYYSFDSKAKNVGIYMDTPEDILALKKIPPVICWFEEWYGENVNTEKLQMCGTDHMAIPFITWEPTGISLEEIADGKHDEYIRSFMLKLSLACPDNDVLIRFAHEMEVTPAYKSIWYSWQDIEDPRIYIDAWRHLVAVAREVNPHVYWVWSPNRANEYSARYYPGDDYVDYVGITMNLSSEHTDSYQDFQDYYENMGGREMLESYGKDIILSEVAFSGDDHSAKEAYLESIFDYYKKDSHIILAAFFNENISDTRKYRITDDPDYMNIFYRGMDELQ